jgi:hypothetical protein
MNTTVPQGNIQRSTLKLFSQPNLDPIATQSSQKLKDEQAKQFEVQTQMFERLGVKNPRVRWRSRAAR